MTAKRYAVTDEQRLAYLAREHELAERFLRGVVNPDDTLKGVQALSEGKLTVPTVHVASGDPMSGYSRIKNLIFVGPEQWSKATTGRDCKNRNPLGLMPDWCPQPVLPYTVEQMKELARFCQVEKDWQTRVVLWLALPEIAGKYTSLISQYEWWGVAHDNLGPGTVRQDVFYSNWYIQSNFDWAIQLPVPEPVYLIGYEHPRWITSKDWADQQKVAADRNMSIVTVSQDALMLNVVRAATGKYLRENTWSRTSTLCDGRPLDVSSYDSSVSVYQRWFLQDDNAGLAASVQGVPLELGF